MQWSMKLTRYIFFFSAAKERTEFASRCLETACKFAVSFLEKSTNILSVFFYSWITKRVSFSDKENSEEGDKDKNEAAVEDEEEDLHPFINMLFHWLLDHHEVEGNSARLRICLMINRSGFRSVFARIPLNNLMSLQIAEIDGRKRVHRLRVVRQDLREHAPEAEGQNRRD